MSILSRCPSICLPSHIRIVLSPDSASFHCILRRLARPRSRALLYSSLNLLLRWSVSTDIPSTDAISSCVQCIWASFSASSKSISFLGLAILITCFYMHRKTSLCLLIKFPVSLYCDTWVKFAHPVNNNLTIFWDKLHSVALAV